MFSPFSYMLTIGKSVKYDLKMVLQQQYCEQFALSSSELAGSMRLDKLTDFCTLFGLLKSVESKEIYCMEKSHKNNMYSTNFI